MGEHLPAILDFLQRVGIAVRLGPVPEDSFLPGVRIESGGLVADETRMLSPGDLLHDAGHIATAPATLRAQLQDNIAQSCPEVAGLELAAVLWSYAAALEARIPPEVVFHTEGYRGDSDWLLGELRAGRFIGIPLMEWMGMAYDTARAQALGVQPFPSMQRWLRD